MNLTEQELRKIEKLDYEIKLARQIKLNSETLTKALQAEKGRLEALVEMQRMKVKEEVDNCRRAQEEKRKYFKEIKERYNITKETFGYDPDSGEIIIDEEVKNE